MRSASSLLETLAVPHLLAPKMCITLVSFSAMIRSADSQNMRLDEVGRPVVAFCTMANKGPFLSFKHSRSLADLHNSSPALSDFCYIQMTSLSTSPHSSFTNFLERNGSWTSRLDDQFIDEEKLPLRLDRIYRDHVKVSWHLSQYVIANAPRPLTEVRF